VAPGQHIARRGSETKQGERVLERGGTLDAAAIAVLATVGKGRVRVGRRPEVALLATGDELVDVWATPTRGRIRNSNGPALAALVRAAGAVPVDLGVASDDREALVKALRAGFQHDVLLVSGGVSAGAYDLVEEALSQYDVKVAFDKVAIKPGAPLVFGRRGDKLVFGLPGNPVSTQVTFDVFVRAALLRLQGARVCSRPTVSAELLAPLRNRSGRRAYLPVALRLEAGSFRAQPLPTMGSADVVAHARANGLAIAEPDQLELAAGARIPVLLVGNFLDRDGSLA
jgi:molybdopterin molybdotransferase